MSAHGCWQSGAKPSNCHLLLNTGEEGGGVLVGKLFCSFFNPIISLYIYYDQCEKFARQQLRAKTKLLTFPPLSIARYSFIQLSQQGHQWRERKCPIFETVARGDSNPGSLELIRNFFLPKIRLAPPHKRAFLQCHCWQLCCSN